MLSAWHAQEMRHTVGEPIASREAFLRASALEAAIGAIRGGRDDDFAEVGDEVVEIDNDGSPKRQEENEELWELSYDEVQELRRAVTASLLHVLTPTALEALADDVRYAEPVQRTVEKIITSAVRGERSALQLAIAVSTAETGRIAITFADRDESWPAQNPPYHDLAELVRSHVSEWGDEYPEERRAIIRSLRQIADGIENQD